MTFTVDPQEEAERKEERLAIIADHLGFSWTELAQELEFNSDQIDQIRTENPNSLQDQSHALLKYWMEREGKHATGFSALHDDIDSPRPERRNETSARQPGSGPPMVSEEDLSASISSLHETTPRGDSDVSVMDLLRLTQKEKLQANLQTHYVEPAQDVSEDGAGVGRVSPELSLPMHCEGKQPPSIREDEPIPIRDFGDSLLEFDQAEPDFSEALVELKQTPQDLTYVSSASFTMTPVLRQRSFEKVSLMADPSLATPQSADDDHEAAESSQQNERQVFTQQHIDEIAERFYRALFGYEVVLLDSTSEENLTLDL
ncbi:hypothetical protein JZ751_008670 [Albula glossodonta]|uniref:Death domain-containing protein n=1 Tax=Albula glossodonta TaxID=121402 RepID=A0A8T2P1A1_9TELE|nr:hypothetical protein JZ751_008670 [Albula glossodonta]